MFNLGFSEIIMIAAIALIVIGPKQLPEVARAIGRMINEFKRATGDITTSFTQAERHVQRFTEETTQSVKKEMNLAEQEQEKLEAHDKVGAQEEAEAHDKIEEPEKSKEPS